MSRNSLAERVGKSPAWERHGRPRHRAVERRELSGERGGVVLLAQKHSLEGPVSSGLNRKPVAPSFTSGGAEERIMVLLT